MYGLQPHELYSFEAEVVPADENRYKFINNEGWKINGVAYPLTGNTCLAHPDGVQNGEYWVKNGVVFKKMKLTNKKNFKENSNEVINDFKLLIANENCVYIFANILLCYFFLTRFF